MPAIASRWKWQSRWAVGAGFAVFWSEPRANASAFAARTPHPAKMRSCCAWKTWRKQSWCLPTRWSLSRFGAARPRNARPVNTERLADAMPLTGKPAAIRHQLISIDPTASSSGVPMTRSDARTKETEHGREREPARVTTDRRRSRAREGNRPRHRHRRHGRCDSESGALALRQRDGSPRRDQSEDRRDAAVAPIAGGRSDRQRLNPDFA